MAITTYTPRDRLEQLVDYVVKALRYWWFAIVTMLVGAALTAAFVMMRKPTYQSVAVLFYQERIQSGLLQGREQSEMSRYAGDRYRELLMAQAQLLPILEDRALNLFPGDYKKDQPSEALEKFRLAIKFEARGANAFRIVFTDDDPDRAKVVTERLTLALQKAEEAIRKQSATATANFAVNQKEVASEELKKREKALAEFLAKHPEFVQDPSSGGSSEGASIRATAKAAGTPGNPRVIALERQRARLTARLNANGTVTVPVKREPSPEVQAALSVVGDLEREYKAAQRELEEAQGKYTDKHPSVLKAREDVATALQRLRRAQASVPPSQETIVPPATPQDRAALERELTNVEAQLADARRDSAAAKPADNTTNWVVKLETEHSDMRRLVTEQRERVEALSESVFRAQIDANQQIAEDGTRLIVVDAATRPYKPVGKGRGFMMAAGMGLFFVIGLGLALAMAILDDRIYQRADLDVLQLAPVLAVIPGLPATEGKKPKAKKGSEP